MKLHKAVHKETATLPFLHQVSSRKNLDRARELRKCPLVVMWVCTMVISYHRGTRPKTPCFPDPSLTSSFHTKQKCLPSERD